MKKRLEGLPRYSESSTTVPAELFNTVKLALLRLSNPLRFAIPGLRNIELILDDEAWVCFDNSLNDMPILAWTEFKIEHRDSLVEPIPCEFYTYHAHAEVILDTVTSYIMEHLDEELHSNLHQGN